MKPSRVLPVLAFLLLTVIAPAKAQEIQVTSANPPAAEQGTVNLNVTIKGKGFKNGAQAKWFVTGTTNPGGVRVNSTTFVNPTELIANIDVDDAATIANFDIEVTSNGRTGKGTELFKVVQKGGLGQCTDIPAKVTVSAANFGTNRIYGDGAITDGAGDTMYQDNVGGVYAKFQVCNQTNDLIINLNGTARFLVFDFNFQLTPPDPLAQAPPGPTPRQAKFMNTNEAFDAPIGAPGVVTRQTFMTSSWPIRKALTQYFRFVNPAAHNTSDEGPGNAAIWAVANTPVNTSLINIEHPDCATWVIYSDTSTQSRVGLVENTKDPKTFISAGQYSTPYRMRVELLGACPTP